MLSINLKFPTLVQHGEVIIHRDVIGYGIARPQEITTPRQAAFQRAADALPDFSFTGTAQEIYVNAA